MKVVKCKSWDIYVYAREHVPPHVHVRYRDKSEVSVDIPLILPRYGATITKEVVESIADNLDKLADAWDSLHPPKEFKTNKQ